jgi:hypothetical protein
MLQIFETVIDACGQIVSRDPMILLFADRDTAEAFVQDHVERSFARGKCGYDLDGDYWWGRMSRRVRGCTATPSRIRLTRGGLRKPPLLQAEACDRLARIQFRGLL